MSLKRNLVANYLGQAWTGVIGLAFVPLYVRYLGVESYGLIGIYSLLQAWFMLLDVGMTPTLGREMARFTAGAHSAQTIRDLLRSIECIGIGIAFLIGALIWAASAWLATHWLTAERLSPSSVAQAILLMGAVVALRFLEGLYRGALLGLQRQVYVNVANSLFATLRAAGAVAVLAWWSPTIEAYFLWQVGVSVAAFAAFVAAVHLCLPPAPAPSRFSRHALADIRHFAGGMLATSLLATLLTQVDKVLLSRLLSLEDFGYYTLAATVGTAVYLLVTPISQSFYPRLTELTVQGKEVELARTYHHGARLVTLLATPGALILMAFGEELLLLWTGDPRLAERVAPLLTLLACGTLFNGYMHIPYALQLASGWTSLAVRINLGAVAILVPAILWATPRYGAIGAAWAWILLNVAYLIVGIQLMHRRLLKAEKWRWYWEDVGAPLMSALVVIGAAKWFQPAGMGSLVSFTWICVSGLLSVLIGLAVVHYHGNRF